MESVIQVTDIREHAMRVIEKLNENNHEAYLVGGYVRDLLLGIPSSDIDITTSATPDEVRGVFPDAKDTGLRFGTVTVFCEGDAFEVTTFRKDMGYDDHRHPSTIVFSDSLEEDLKRRDFTVNAFAMDAKGRVIDLFAGTEDLKHKIIRAIGDPGERFKEDALRILRAFRFTAKLDFDIEQKTLSAIIEDMPLLKRIANERILDELKKMIELPFVKKAMTLMNACGVGRVFPELKKGLERVVASEEPLADDGDFFTLCRHENEKPFPKTWRFSNRERTEINRDALLLDKVLSEGFDAYDVYTHGMDRCLKVNRLQRFYEPRKDDESEIARLKEDLPITSAKDLAFRGADIRELEALDDPASIGGLLNEIERKIIAGELKNDRDSIKTFVEERLREEQN